MDYYRDKNKKKIEKKKNLQFFNVGSNWYLGYNLK